MEFCNNKPISAPKAVERIIVTGIATHPAVCAEITAAMLEQRAALAPMEISVPTKCDNENTSQTSDDDRNHVCTEQF